MDKELVIPIAIGVAVGTGLSLGMPPEDKDNRGRDKYVMLSGLIIGGVGVLAIHNTRLGGAMLMTLGITSMVRGVTPGVYQSRRQLASGAVATMMGLGCYLGTEEVAKDIGYVILGMGATSFTAGTLDLIERKIVGPTASGPGVG